MNKKKNLIIFLTPIVLFPLLLYFIDFYKSEIDRFPFPCPFRLHLGIYCAGCGATRSIYALTEGHFAEALHNNAPLVLLIIFLFLVWIQNFLELLGRNIKIIPRSKQFYIFASGTVILYYILRNFIPTIAPLS